MKQIILGTAGHIDHGKTSLVKALTGINTDRLKEEQERGITIELGFAHLQLPSGLKIAIIDVPGHEKFVKTMVAGAFGIDILALIIAADESVMPQTKEHLEICSLLNIKNGCIVLTKIDMIDKDWLELVKEDVKKFVQNTFLENKPVICVSSLTGEGIPELIKTLDDLAKLTPSKTNSGIFRLPVDRVFTIKGFGTVITGTSLSGKIKNGESVMIYPSKNIAKIRGLQAHNQDVLEAEAGMRTAINFQNLDKDFINRGDIISRSESLTTSYLLDAKFTYLASNKKNLKNRTKIRFHCATSEISGSIILLNKEELMPGEDCFVQIYLDSLFIAIKNDRFVIRSYSPSFTIGGGHILNPIPKKHKRFNPELISFLEILSNGSNQEIILNHIEKSGYDGLNLNELLILTNLPEKELNLIIQKLLSLKNIAKIDKNLFHASKIQEIKDKIKNLLDNYHKDNTLKLGISKEELKSRLSISSTKLEFSKFFNFILDNMQENKLIIIDSDLVRLYEHKIFLETKHEKLKQDILKNYQDNMFSPIFFKEICQGLNIELSKAKEILNLLIKEQKIIKIQEDLCFCQEAIKIFKQKLINFLDLNKQASVADIKELTGLPRKYLIPLIEYFDSIGLTLRVGDLRKLRKI